MRTVVQNSRFLSRFVAMVPNMGPSRRMGSAAWCQTEALPDGDMSLPGSAIPSWPPTGSGISGRTKNEDNR